MLLTSHDHEVVVDTLKTNHGCLCVHVGPPESMREHVVAAAHAMQRGDWKACKDYITSIKVGTIICTRTCTTCMYVVL